jgi:uncharacterized protein (DUF1499 family)
MCGDGSIRAMFDWKRPANLGAKHGRLAPCRPSPNCVSSQADPADGEHYIAAIPFRGDAIPAIRNVLASIADVTIVSEEKNYLYAEFRTRLMRFVDDVEFLYDEQAGLIHVRSASRLGRRDFGVNRKRVETLRARLLR